MLSIALQTSSSLDPAPPPDLARNADQHPAPNPRIAGSRRPNTRQKTLSLLPPSSTSPLRISPSRRAKTAEVNNANIRPIRRASAHPMKAQRNDVPPPPNAKRRLPLQTATSNTQKRPITSKQRSDFPPPPLPKCSSPIATHPSKASILPFSPYAAISIPDTSPRKIKNLWQRVMAPKRIPLRGGAGKGRGGGAGGGGARGRGRVETMAEADSEEDEDIDVETRSRSQDIGDDTSTSATKDTAAKLNAVMKWRNRVFVPRGIYISDEEIWEPGFFHFKFFKADEEQCRQWVMQKIELQEDGDTVFLRGGDEFNQGLAAQYTEMVSRRLCEEEFATLAKEKLFRRPPFLPVEGSGRAWRAERVIQLSTKVGSNRWVPPPFLSGEDLDGCKDFSLRPDCAYWLSVQAFSKSHRGLVERATYTPSDTHRIITPYLTIEFKKTDKTVEQATNQAIAASALALFNRFQLKGNYLNARKRAWNKNHFDQIRHYAMTFTGPTAIVWLVKLKEPSAADFSKVSWNGCEAVKIRKSVCSASGDVDDLVDYINAIHRWGIEHGENCRRDVKGILMSMAGVKARVSELFDPNELEQDDDN